MKPIYCEHCGEDQIACSCRATITVVTAETVEAGSSSRTAPGCPNFELEPSVNADGAGSGGAGGVAEIGQSHPTLTSKSIMYGTPLWLFRELDREFRFEVDVCAVPELALCLKFYTPEVDGLLQEWEGVCWMNPPYGRGIERWVAKALESSQRGATVVCLLPARVDAAWFHDFVWKSAELRFLRGRLTFRGFAGRGTANGMQAPFPCMIAVFRPVRSGGGGGVLVGDDNTETRSGANSDNARIRDDAPPTP